jgi:Protein of unknown function (DUF3617)
MTIRASLSLSLAVALLCATACAADNTPLNVKTGEWETTMTGDSSGYLAVLQEAFAKMPPEQRAKMEAAMGGKKGVSARGPLTTVHKSCLGKKDLAMPFRGNEGESCKRTVVTSSATKQEIRLECMVSGNKQTGTMKLEAVDSGNVKGLLQMVVSLGARTENMNYNLSAKWLGPVCSESKK